MTSPELRSEGILIGANRQSHVSDYCKSQELVVFGASCNVALWKPLDNSHKGVYRTLKKHTKEVTGVRFVNNSSLLISVGEDGQMNIWEQVGQDRFPEFRLRQSSKCHEESITCLCAPCGELFVTGSSDGIVNIWRHDKSDGYKVAHSFKLKLGYYPLALAIQCVDAHRGSYVLAVGGTSTNILIYSLQLLNDSPDLSFFEQSAVLSGHEDWVKCLSFVAVEFERNYLLASASQDTYIRLWRMCINDRIDDSDEESRKLILLSNKQHKFSINQNTRASISFDALIVGHDDWISGLTWRPGCEGETNSKNLQLLSCTADTALMIWQMDEDSGIWCCVNRLGEISIKGASTATGASGGFWSCVWFEDHEENEYILTNGKTGSFRLYKSKEKELSTYEPILAVTGPLQDVTDVVWSPNGDYFFATSLDQTTRLIAPWVHEDGTQSWHEFARPQIHGYNMVTIANIDSTKYVSGAEEKILRVFEVTLSTNKLLHRLCHISLVTQPNQTLPEAASLPVLGLSNKAANEQLEAGEMAQQQQDIEENNEVAQTTDDILGELKTPPLEDHLQRFTLYPELEKLYGHGYEITSCDTNPSGNLIASACRSNNIKHAVVRIFNVQNSYQQSDQPLEGHTLTITSLEFSPDGKYLLTVSRDRQFFLWEVVDELNAKFHLVGQNLKAHSRIIWDCSWAPLTSHGAIFFTVSRDKQIKAWQVRGSEVINIASEKLPEPATSVSCFKKPISGGKFIVGVGLENGYIKIYYLEISNGISRMVPFLLADPSITPAGRIERLSFSPRRNRDLMLAVASQDSSIRLYYMNISELDIEASI